MKSVRHLSESNKSLSKQCIMISLVTSLAYWFFHVCIPSVYVKDHKNENQMKIREDLLFMLELTFNLIFVCLIWQIICLYVWLFLFILSSEPVSSSVYVGMSMCIVIHKNKIGYNEQYSTSKVQRKIHNRSRANMNF